MVSTAEELELWHLLGTDKMLHQHDFFCSELSTLGVVRLMCVTTDKESYLILYLQIFIICNSNKS